MDRQRLQKLAGILTEAKYDGMWMVIEFNRYDASDSSLMKVNAGNPEEALQQALDPDMFEVDEMLRGLEKGDGFYAIDEEEVSYLIFPV